MKARIKQEIGTIARNVAERLPTTKQYLAPLGMRAGQGCFGDLPGSVQFHNRPGFKVTKIDDNYLSFQLFWRGGDFYEPITRTVIEALAEQGGTFFDIGANIGFYSLALGSLYPSLEIVAFEPNPKNFRILHDNAFLNGFSHIRLEHLALSDTTGFAPLFISESDMSASLIRGFEPQFTVQSDVVTVRTSTLDEYLQANPVTGKLLIKVDIEGHEDAFFSRSAETIAKRHPDFIVEILGEEEPPFASVLREAGYTFYRITDQGLTETKRLVRCVRPPFEFLNCLATQRPKWEIELLAQRIRPTISKLNLFETSKYFPERYPMASSEVAA